MDCQWAVREGSLEGVCGAGLGEGDDSGMGEGGGGRDGEK